MEQEQTVYRSFQGRDVFANVMPTGIACREVLE
jgi:hypothetical protein